MIRTALQPLCILLLKSFRLELIQTVHDFELFDGVSQCEYEANCFAADYLLEDEDVLEMLNADMSFFQAAAELKVPPELLDFKFE